MEKFPFGTFGPEHLKHIKPGIDCFNNQEYWDCHEVLEDIWLEQRNDPARYIYWAVIQVATALFHYENNNIAGANGMLKKAKEKFQVSEKQKIETNLVYKFLSWQELKDLVFAIPEDAKLEDYDTLYAFRFKEYKW